MTRVWSVVQRFNSTAAGRDKARNLRLGSSFPEHTVWSRRSPEARAFEQDNGALARRYSDSVHLVELGVSTLRSNAEWRGVVPEVFGGVQILERRPQPLRLPAHGRRAPREPVWSGTGRLAREPIPPVPGEIAGQMHDVSPAGNLVE